MAKREKTFTHKDSASHSLVFGAGMGDDGAAMAVLHNLSEEPHDVTIRFSVNGTGRPQVEDHHLEGYQEGGDIPTVYMEVPNAANTLHTTFDIDGNGISDYTMEHYNHTPHGIRVIYDDSGETIFADARPNEEVFEENYEQYEQNYQEHQENFYNYDSSTWKT
ncbi:hypothetical protein BGZ76_006411 [Entomortierella beljakovae]|nr:hypothetical protein BGZ76_006411 [Entomortierella beljakovae]